MFTTLFFILLMVYIAVGGNTGEAAKYGCLWIILCFIGEMLMWGLFFLFFGSALIAIL